MPDINTLLSRIESYAQQKMLLVDPGHDFGHIQRVLYNAILISSSEPKANEFVVKASVFLHDILDSKLFDVDVERHELVDFLYNISCSKQDVDSILEVIDNVSFANSFDSQNDKPSIECQIVSDADKLDAMGAIGIARAFCYGGNKNREIFNPNIAPKKYNTKQEYRNSKSPSINHFYEKLLNLKDKMHTQTAKNLANKRHDFMLLYLSEFFSEVGFEGFNQIQNS